MESIFFRMRLPASGRELCQKEAAPEIRVSRKRNLSAGRKFRFRH